MLQISDAMLQTSTAVVCNGNSDRTAVCEHFIILEKGALVKYTPPGTEGRGMVQNTGDVMPSTPTQRVSVQSEESSNPPQPPTEIPRDNDVNIEAVNGKSETSSMLSTTNSAESENSTENIQNNSENSLLCCCSISITKHIKNTCPCLKPVLWDEDTEPCCCCCPRRNEDVTRWCCCSCWNWGIFYKETRKSEVIIHENLYFQLDIKFQWWDFIFGVLGIGLYVLDVVTDLWLAYTLFSQGHVVYFSITLVFVLLAYIVNGFVTLVGYKGEGVFNGMQWIPVIVGVLFNMGPCMSTAMYLYYGCKSRQTGLSRWQRETYVYKTKNHKVSSSWLRLSEALLEAAPQLVFQLYLLVLMPEIHGTEGVMRVLSVLSSWFNLSLALATYNKAYRNNTEYNTRHMIFDCLRRMAETGGRVLSIALFTSVFGYWVLALLVPHVVIMLIWHCSKSSHSRENVINNLLVSCFSLFEFWPDDLITGGADMRRSRIYYLVFYVFFHSENVAMLLLWYLYAEGPVDWVRPWGLVVGLVFLPLHVGLLLLYYGLCHPSSENIRDKGRSQWCEKNVWRAVVCERKEEY